MSKKTENNHKKITEFKIIIERLILYYQGI